MFSCPIVYLSVRPVSGGAPCCAGGAPDLPRKYIDYKPSEKRGRWRETAGGVMTLSQRQLWDSNAHLWLASDRWYFIKRSASEMDGSQAEAAGARFVLFFFVKRRIQSIGPAGCCSLGSSRQRSETRRSSYPADFMLLSRRRRRKKKPKNKLKQRQRKKWLQSLER